MSNDTDHEIGDTKPVTFGAFLRTFREYFGLTQADIPRTLKVTERQVRYYEADKRGPAWRVMTRASSYFGQKVLDIAKNTIKPALPKLSHSEQWEYDLWTKTVERDHYSIVIFSGGSTTPDKRAAITSAFESLIPSAYKIIGLANQIEK